MLNKKMLSFSVMGMVISSLCGCAATVPSLTPGAENMTISEKAPPANCKKLTDITAQQSGVLLSAQSLERGAMTQIRNSAYQQHANYLQLKANYSETRKNSLHSDAVSSVIIKGIAYSCP